MAEGSDPPPTPFKRAQSGRRALRSEQAGAKAHGGRRQPASGARWFAKGDIRGNGYLIQDKTTAAKSFSITQDDWRKVEAEATRTPPGLLPAMRITLPGLPVLLVVREADWLHELAEADDEG